MTTLAPPLPAHHVDTTPDVYALVAERVKPRPDPGKRLLWLTTARENQLPPAGVDWSVWFILAGRGFGKTRSGAEHTADFARKHPGAEIGVIGRTDAEARRLLLKGPSGLLSVLEPWEIKRCVISPGDTVLELYNGSTIYVTGANSPDALRGLNLWMAWCDELAAWRYQQTIWDDVLEPAVRIGPHPHILVTTTPKPTRLIRSLLNDDDAVVTRGSTFDNADNLSPKFLRRMRRKYDVDEHGRARTRAGRQELNAEVLDDVPGALVTRAALEASRVTPVLDDDGTILMPKGVKLDGKYREAVVALDPADGTEEGDEQALALIGLGYDHELYIEHTDGMRASVDEYLKAGILLAHQEGATLVVEKNHGGAYLVRTIEQTMKELGVIVPLKMVRASDNKRVRAEPIVPLFNRNKLHFVGSHAEVEDQLCSWVGAAGEKSPDRMDAVVWGVTHFLGHTLEAPDENDPDGAYAYAQTPGASEWADDDSSYSYD